MHKPGAVAGIGIVPDFVGAPGGETARARPHKTYNYALWPVAMARQVLCVRYSLVLFECDCNLTGGICIC